MSQINTEKGDSFSVCDHPINLNENNEYLPLPIWNHWTKIAIRFMILLCIKLLTFKEIRSVIYLSNSKDYIDCKFDL